MISEGNEDAVDACCDMIIAVAYQTCVSPADMTLWVRERHQTRYDYKDVE